ncbi:MAG: S9 family peptidase [Planctomycetaceae bacterium]|nr:S9 family peptidase [Planctomycetaceae bacterium]
MKSCVPLPFAMALFLMTAPLAVAGDPPVAPVKPVTDDYHGTPVVDPYRYMENFKDPEVQKWVDGQAEYAAQRLRSIPSRDAFLKRIAELDAGAPYMIFGVTRLPDGRLFYMKQLAAENVAKVYVRDGTNCKERLLIDPDTFPKHDPAEHFALSFYRVSPDGQQVIYGFAASGSEQTTLKVFDLATDRDLPEAIDRIEAEYAPPYWLPDGESFVYGRRRQIAADAPATDGYKFTRAFRHELGADVDKDSIVFAEGAGGSPAMAEMDFPAVIVPIGSEWAVGQIKHGDETDITIYAKTLAALCTSRVQWTKVCDRSDQVTAFAVRGDDIYLLTAQDAPRFKVVRTSLAKPDFGSSTVVVPPGRYVVESLAVAQDALYVGILDGVRNKILRVPFTGPAKPEAMSLPADEPSGRFSAIRADQPGLFVRTFSWTREGRLYEYDPVTKQLSDTRLVPRGKFDAPDWLTSTEVMVSSHDRVKVPLSIVYRKDLRRDGSNPTVLSGYGAYGHTDSMHFDPTDLAWLERGGVLATAHVRGSGAFGKEWHHAGRRRTKPNTWKDFIACAEFLVKEKYTTPAKLAGEGGSAGGILIGRAITERPDLFAAAHIAVGCTDMLRFETTMNGPPNIPEFGTVTKADEFGWLLAMSTFHQIHDGVKYPGVILTHGVNDPRVEPWESAKATARLQAATASGRPVLFRVDRQAGHGIGSTKQQRHEEQADVWAFMLWQFGERAFQPNE